MLNENAKEHCESVGKDKRGFTNCRECPSNIRDACHSSHGAHSPEMIKQWHKRVNNAVKLHYKTLSY